MTQTDTLKETIKNYGKNLQHGLFATPDTVEAAVKQAYDLIETMDNPTAGFTALHVVLNAIGKELKEIAE